MEGFCLKALCWFSRSFLVRKPLRFAELLVRIYSDELPKTASAIYLVSETADNENSVLDMGANLVHDGYTDTIAIAGFGAQRGYPGFLSWISLLRMDRQLVGTQVIPIPWVDRDGAFDTRTELIDLISYATEMKWETIILVAPPFHLARAFMCAVCEVINQRSDLKVYAKSGFVDPWDETVIHSQGNAVARRKDLIFIELMAILALIIKGDLPKIKTVREYLDRRG